MSVQYVGQSRGYVYNAGTMAWEAMVQPDSSASLTNTQLRATPIATIRAALTHASSNGTPVVSATNTILVAAPSAANHLRIHRLHASNSGATSTWVYWRDGIAGTLLLPCYLPQNGIVSIDLIGSWNLTGGGTPKALYLNTSAAGSVEWGVSYATEAD